MHAKLPFDDEKTVRKLGEKLFSRIRDDKDRDLLRAFFASPANGGPKSSP